jgi:hypothetical protein
MTVIRGDNASVERQLLTKERGGSDVQFGRERKNKTKHTRNGRRGETDIWD